MKRNYPDGCGLLHDPNGKDELRLLAQEEEAMIDNVLTLGELLITA